jgi:hypothetical protein
MRPGLIGSITVYVKEVIAARYASFLPQTYFITIP